MVFVKVVEQISSLIGLQADGVLCARAGSVLDKDEDGVYVLGAAGDLAGFINERLESIQRKNCDANHPMPQNRNHIFGEDFSVLYMDSSGYEAAVYIQAGNDISDVDRQLLEVFLSSVSVGYENVNLFHQLRNVAFRDYMTKLPNRNEFINMLDDLNRTDNDFDADIGNCGH